MSTTAPVYSGRISRQRRWLLYAIGIGLWLSGALWLTFHYLFMRTGEFGPTPHPSEIWWLKIHGAFAFASIWMFGLLWGIHVSKALPFPRRKGSGISLVAGFGLLIVTGYLLYYVGNDSARSVVSVVHWAIGLASPSLFFLHRARPGKRKIRSERSQINLR